MSYLDWLEWIVFPDINECKCYSKVLSGLFDIEFDWKIDHDRNRAKDGLGLRERYEEEMDVSCWKDGPCSVLEMMVALAMRCEDQIMYDPDEGDRTWMWFWEMFNNLGLSALTDDFFDEREFRAVVSRFLGRRYRRDGYGGPFYIPETELDMRKVELWYQLNYYLQSKFL